MTNLLIKLAEMKEVLKSIGAHPPYKVKMTRENYERFVREAENSGILRHNGDAFNSILGMQIEVEDDPSEIHRPRAV